MEGTNVVDLTQDDDDNANAKLQVWIPMPPCAKPSVRFGPGRGNRFKGWFRAYVDNDVKRDMQQFGSLVQQAATAAGFTMFPRTVPVVIKVWCFLCRPQEDFIGRRREMGNLRVSAITANTVVAVKPDTDNLAKFILDALTGVAFADDAQIVDLHMFKSRDSQGLCRGRVAVEVSRFNGNWRDMLPGF